eukprot:2255373-Prymnesium_polylepis.1
MAARHSATMHDPQFDVITVAHRPYLVPAVDSRVRLWTGESTTAGGRDFQADVAVLRSGMADMKIEDADGPCDAPNAAHEFQYEIMVPSSLVGAL